MIDPKELRIGNTVNLETYVDGEGVKIIPTRVTHHLIADAVRYQDNWTGSPIPLTPEWLERLGFEIDGFGNYFKKLGTRRRLEFAFYRDGEIEWVLYFDENAVLNKECIYVHTLQNLWKALTGEELCHHEAGSFLDR